MRGKVAPQPTNKKAAELRTQQMALVLKIRAAQNKISKLSALEQKVKDEQTTIEDNCGHAWSQPELDSTTPEESKYLSQGDKYVRRCIKCGREETSKRVDVKF